MSREKSRDPKNVKSKKDYIKKLPLELTRFEGELSEFTHKSMIEPLQVSFFGALGLGILESLVRIKSKSYLIETAWNTILTRLGSVKDFVKDLRLSKQYDEFLDFLKNLKQSSRKDAVKTLENMASPVTASIDLDKGFRILYCALIDLDYKLILNGTIPPVQVLTEITKVLSIHVLHIYDFTYTLYKHQNIAPLVYLYSNNSHFGLVYHMSLKYLDEKSDNFGIDFRSFPFLHNPSKALKLKVSEDSNSLHSNFMDIFNLLVKNLRPLDADSKSDLFKHVMSLKKVCPEMQEKIQDLYEKAINRCTHISKEYTPVCLNSHCKDCLIDLVLESSNNVVFCPCGVQLDESDIQFLTSDTVAETPKKQSRKSKFASLSPVRKENEKILTRKNSIRDKNTSFSQTLTRLPVISNKICCSICRRQLNKTSFDGVNCLGHSICIQCRSKRFKKGAEQCPACNRFYNNDEIVILKMACNNIELTSNAFNKSTFLGQF